jgi:UDP-arabinose 4-epimerase
MTTSCQRVLVTSGAGYVGAHTCKALAASGYVPVVFNDFSRGHEDTVRWEPLIKGDIRDAEALSSAINSTGTSAILYFAAKAELVESLADPMLYYDVNVGSAVALCRAAAATNFQTLVFSSPCAVYGMPDSDPIRKNRAICSN